MNTITTKPATLKFLKSNQQSASDIIISQYYVFKINNLNIFDLNQINTIQESLTGEIDTFSNIEFDLTKIIRKIELYKTTSKLMEIALLELE